MTRALALVLALAACADTTPQSDRGGSVFLRAAEIETWRGPKALPLYCSSACTMGLGYENACVRPEATFGFHRVRNDPTGQMQRLYEAHLPAPLRAWYRETAADRDDTVRLSGARLIREGWAPSCPADP